VFNKPVGIPLNLAIGATDLKLDGFWTRTQLTMVFYVLNKNLINSTGTYCQKSYQRLFE